MRYPPRHKAEVHKKIVADASRRFRAEGLTGAAVTAVMRDNGLTHGGFYKHFENKDELLIASLGEAFEQTGETLLRAAEDSTPGSGWRAIIETYLSPEFCNETATGCPLTALAPELARATPELKAHIFPQLLRYKDRMTPHMPGRNPTEQERAFFRVYSTMIGATDLARMLPEPAMRLKVLTFARDFLFSSAENGTLCE